jgi:hypothetical protein
MFGAKSWPLCSRRHTNDRTARLATHSPMSAMSSRCCSNPRRIACERCLDRLWMQDLLLYMAFDRGAREHGSRKISCCISVGASKAAELSYSSCHPTPTKEMRVIKKLFVKKGVRPAEAIRRTIDAERWVGSCRRESVQFWTSHKRQEWCSSPNRCPATLRGFLPVWRKLFGLGLQADSSTGERCSQKT